MGLLVVDAIETSFGDFSRSAAALLLSLHYHGPMTATELAVIGGVTQPTAVRVVGGLIRRGLVVQEGRSGRTAPLALTPEGSKSALALQAARLEAMERLLAILPKAERVQFERSLDRLLASAIRSRTFARRTCRLCDHRACSGPLCPIGTRASELELDGNAKG
ncbi:MarR family winged helix-turn-helix transcriptional regulator [Halodurantibacterium flavum]|uniref:MarR family winged helix-turn-helix transcriptional regulator n=1 Tax=Halodurantibacterium flavum TaxID=1382802 RepID=A0ABW4S1A9_9RHOB